MIKGINWCGQVHTCGLVVLSKANAGLLVTLGCPGMPSKVGRHAGRVEGALVDAYGCLSIVHYLSMLAHVVIVHGCFAGHSLLVYSAIVIVHYL